MSVSRIKKPRSVGVLLATTLFLSVGFKAQAQEPVTTEPSPNRGKALAERVCTNCHLVSDTQTEAVADVPSFREIADQPHQTPGSIMAKIAIPSHPMPVIPITKRELEDVSAYIMSLRSE